MFRIKNDNLDLISFPSITGVDEKSFAHFTIKRRLPAILDQLILEFNAEKAVIQKLELLKDNIIHGKISLFPETGPDGTKWKTYISKYIDESWFNVPFFFAEAYFYRMILEYTRYFENGEDPFFKQKMADIRKLHSEIDAMIQTMEGMQTLSRQSAFEKLLHTSLWGNKSDLSQLYSDTAASQDYHTLIDDSVDVSFLMANRVKQIDIILDNSGMELLTDLLLSVYLVDIQLVDRLILHVKAYPTFVSDATSKDIYYLLDYLEEIDSHYSNNFVRMVKKLLADGKLIISSHPFWNSPLHFYEMPFELIETFLNTDILVIKGDANYRRVFGDRVIPHNVNPWEFTAYLKCKTLSIRILKSEIMLGINNKTEGRLNKMDPNWLVNGHYGIIQKLNSF